MKINLNFYIHFLHLSSLISSGLDSKASTCITVLISHARKVVLKILQARLQQDINRELPDMQAGFIKGRGTRDQIANICSRKTSISALLTMLKSLIDHNKLWEILKEMGIPFHFNCLLRKLYAGPEIAVRTRHGTMDWFQMGKGKHQGCILSSCLFNLYA